MWVVKLGGSLFSDPRLRDWLSVLADAGAGRAVIVPGGGPFADQVREAQARWGFPDRAAHRMALQAMAQYGRMLMALEPRLVPAVTAAEARRALDGSRVPVWLPGDSLGSGYGLAEDWTVTSDTLALWLAEQLGAASLLLVKSIEGFSSPCDLGELKRRGVVDAAFPAHVSGVGRAWWCGPGDAARLARALVGAGSPGTEIPVGRECCAAP